MGCQALKSKIAERRLKVGLSQRALAELAGCARTFICQLENRETTPRPETLRRLAGALGCRPADLLPDYFFEKVTRREKVSVSRG
jgi:transcriptional regulator with XRE-family HTH domain